MKTDELESPLEFRLKDWHTSYIDGTPDFRGVRDSIPFCSGNMENENHQGSLVPEWHRDPRIRWYFLWSWIPARSDRSGIGPLAVSSVLTPTQDLTITSTVGSAGKSWILMLTAR